VGTVGGSSYVNFNFSIRFFFGGVLVEKGIVEEYKFISGSRYGIANSLIPQNSKKHHLGPQNGPESLGPEKL
jgi:hypothetical protein